MALMAASYWWVKCDQCGVDCDYGDYAAWKDAEHAVEIARDAHDWQVFGDAHYCPDCQRCRTCGAPAGDSPGERDYECSKCYLTKDACAGCGSRLDRCVCGDLNDQVAP